MTTADQLLQELRGTATLEELGRQFGVTRERIRQILAKHDIPRRPLKARHQCVWCNTEIGWYSTFCQRCFEWSLRTIIICRVCGAHKVVRTADLKWRRKHDRRYQHASEYCSRSCAAVAKWDADIDGSCLRRRGDGTAK